jgi:2-succinyl-5-enolpyruvyl-6-hydroxy-3-cyclohexene-1-carboxylate synthase
MKTNISCSKQILNELYGHGVREVALCAGARNSPLVALLDKAQDFQVYSFFEERSAAFFMMGCARRSRRPAAIITTSGTAVAELLPAVIEAFHEGVPLVVISADRPRRLRGSGAPQSIDQTGLFGKFVSQEFDLESEDLKITNWDLSSPVHINICFDEPLLDEPIEVWHPTFASVARAHSQVADNRITESVQSFKKFFAKVRKPLVIVGTLDSLEEQKVVTQILSQWQLPCYIEATSGLREAGLRTLKAGDASLGWALREKFFDGVVRIGAVPTVRIWRDLDDPKTRCPVFSISSLPFKGLHEGEIFCGSLSLFLGEVLSQNVGPASSPGREQSEKSWFQKDAEGVRLLESLYRQEPKAEPSLMFALSKLIKTDELVFVGNSLPIREWDLSASFDQPRWVQANRGVNGIDGQLSTFLGLSVGRTVAWSVVGDLTALYDLAAPWALSYLQPTQLRFVVVNNGGGKIFSRIFRNPRFENRHNLQFAPWAELWQLDYQKWSEVPVNWTHSKNCVIELVPDELSTQRFYNAYDAFWRKA